jgi:CPA2 family monovalent cation:H+ antiporter-2
MGASLLVIVGTSLLTSAAGLSMALGAFLAGLLLAETEYRRELEVTIEPFKGLLIGVFFFSVGLSLEVGRMLADPWPILGAVVALVAIKFALAYPLLRAFGIGRAAALESAALLAPAGEFAFVVIGLALSLGVVSSGPGGFAIAVTSLSLALLPLIAMGARAAAQALAPAAAGTVERAHDLPEQPPEAKVLIVGFGRVGQLVASMLVENGVSYLAVDSDAASVAEGRRAGRPVFYGNASRPEFLARCGLMQAAAVVVTMDDRGAVEAVSREVRAMRPDVVLVARAKDRAHARDLYARGVTEAVPEAFEASLHLAEATLIGAGVPLGLAIASVHERRDRFREEFQTIDRGDARTGVARLRARQRSVAARKPADASDDPAAAPEAIAGRGPAA